MRSRDHSGETTHVVLLDVQKLPTLSENNQENPVTVESSQRNPESQTSIDQSATVWDSEAQRKRSVA